LLFSLVVDSATRDLCRPPPWTLIYADDVALSDSSTEGLEAQAQAWKERLQQYGLHLNVAKTEFMVTNPPNTMTDEASIAVDGISLTRSTAFKYLGSYL